MEDKQDRQSSNPQPAQLNEPWRTRLIAYIERKLHERAAKKKQESAQDRLAQRTANATVWIAIFTVVLAGAALLTLWQVIAGGSDTHDLALAAKSQAELAHQQALALQQAVVRIQVSDFVLESPMSKPALPIGLRNEGIAVATKVGFHGALTWKDEPRHVSGWQPTPINIEIPAMPQGDKGAKGYTFTIPELSQNMLKMIRQSTKNRTIELRGALTYANGFDQFIVENICKIYFAPALGDPAYVGWIDCEQYPAKVKWWDNYEREHQKAQLPN